MEMFFIIRASRLQFLHHDLLPCANVHCLVTPRLMTTTMNPNHSDELQ